MDLKSEIQKINVGIRISIVKMSYVPIVRKNEQLWLFWLKFAQKWILGSEFQKCKSGFEICTSKFHVCLFSVKTDNFDFFGPNLPKNGFWDQNFKNLGLDSESASLGYYVYQFSDITDNFEFLDPKLPKNGFWGRNFKNLNLDVESASLRYYVHEF